MPFKKNKKKVAILIVGHLRTCNYTLKSLQKFLFKIVEADTFVSTYTKYDTNEPRWWRGSLNKNKIVNRELIKKMYSAKGVVVSKEKPIKTFPLDSFLNHKSGFLLQMLENFLRCYHLSKRYGNYKRYICIRPDLEFFSKVDLNEVGDAKNIYFPRNDFFTERGSICDTWVICNSHYFRILTDYKKQIIPKILNSKTNIPHQEDCLHKFLQKNQVKIKLSKTRWGLRRSKTRFSIWDQKIGKYLGNRNLFIRKLIVLLSKSFFSSGTSTKYTFLKLGFEKHESDSKIHQRKKIIKKKHSTTPKWLPRFRSGKHFIEGYFKK